MNKVPFKTNEGYVFFNTNDIVRFEASRNHILVYVVSVEKPYNIQMSITEIQLKLNNEKIMFKCHRCHLINLMHVLEFKEKSRIILTNNGSVPLSETYLKSFKETWCVDQ